MLEGIVDSLNRNAGTWQVGFTFVLAIATVFYAILTARLVSETRWMRQAQTDARISVAIETRPEWLNFIDFRIRNEGLGPAYDIKFQVEELNPNGEKEFLDRIRELGAVRHGIRHLSPDQSIATFLGSMVGGKTKLQTRIGVKVSYANAAGERKVEDHVLDLSTFEGMHQVGVPPLHKIAKNMESIAKDIAGIASGFNRPHVLTQAKRDYERELEEWVDERGQPDSPPVSSDTQGEPTTPDESPDPTRDRHN